MNAPRAFGYTGVGWGPFKIHGGGSASTTTSHTTRRIAFAATVPNELGQLVPLSDGIDRIAEGTQDEIASDEWSELKDTLKVKGWTYDWRTGIRQARIARKPFQETGAGSISLSGGDDTVTTREADVNINIFRGKGSFRPRFLVNYRRQFAPDVTTADLTFAGQPNGNFQVDGLPIPTVEYSGLAGFTKVGLFGLEYTLEYTFTHSKEETHNALSFRMRFR
jgi:hypothetical protein